jgi:predicted acylesterase/phospholipase RssA
MLPATSPLSDSPAPAFHILALSGGGFRGLYTATVLESLEKASGVPLARRFDLICGTSAGGLLAMGLAAEVPASNLRGIFEQSGRRIFGSPCRVARAWRSVKSLLIAKHSSSGLKSVLEEHFGQKTVGDLRHRILIPSVNCSTGRGQFFKTPHAPTYRLDHTLRLVDVGLATTAAPTYFPVHDIPDRGPFADGGLVANSPGLLGLHEAEHCLGVPHDTTVRVLAIGTMGLGATLSGSAIRNRGVLLWRAKVFDLVLSAQEYAAEAMLRHKLADNYFRIDDPATPDQCKDIASLDLASPAATYVLTSRASHAAQRTLGDTQFGVFLSHIAATPNFFHGPNKNA